MRRERPALFRRRHFEAEIIILCVRWYLRYPLSFRQLEEIMGERKLNVDHVTIWRWVQRYAPELNRRKACLTASESSVVGLLIKVLRSREVLSRSPRIALRSASIITSTTVCGSPEPSNEGPDDIHAVSRNASSTKPAKFLVFLIGQKGAPLVVPAR